MDFASSLSPASGSNIMRLEAKQDNRDGYAIRAVTRYLTSRSEKNRVLFVFTDGEPAAADYHENGILELTKRFKKHYILPILRRLLQNRI